MLPEFVIIFSRKARIFKQVVIKNYVIVEICTSHGVEKGEKCFFVNSRCKLPPCCSPLRELITFQSLKNNKLFNSSHFPVTLLKISSL